VFLGLEASLAGCERAIKPPRAIGDNAGAVVDQLFSLGAASRDVADFQGPYLGVKFAKENVREFSEEVRSIAHLPQHPHCTTRQLHRTVITAPRHLQDCLTCFTSCFTPCFTLFLPNQVIVAGKCIHSQQTAGSVAVEKEKG